MLSILKQEPIQMMGINKNILLNKFMKMVIKQN